MSQVATHSNLVGGSTASRVLACPGSVALVEKMPPRPSSSYADEGTLLHDVMSDLLSSDKKPHDFLGRKYKDITFTEDHIFSKIRPALKALEEIDPDGAMEIEVETRVHFGDLIPGAFGSVDVIGRLGERVIVLDWKFGDGVAVSATNNKQLLFYAAAARRTLKTQWAFKGAKQLELIIVQPPYTRRWVTDFETLNLFELDLVRAVKLAQQPDAPIAHGDHCRWCTAKPICPAMNGAIERMIKIKHENLDRDEIGRLLHTAAQFEDWIKDLRALAFEMLKHDTPVPGWKMVAKKGQREWRNEDDAYTWLKSQGVNPLHEPEMVSPAQAEKLLKKVKTDLPEELVRVVSSGSTLAPESDPRPAVLNIGRQLTAALSKLQ